MTRWPVIKTQPISELGESLRAWATTVACTTALSLVIGALLFGLSTAMCLWWCYYPLNSKLEAFGLFAIFSPIVALPTAVLLTPAIVAALMRGWAGWGTAVLFGAISGPLAFLALEEFIWTREILPMGISFGTAFAALFWMVGRWTNPQAFEPVAP